MIGNGYVSVWHDACVETRVFALAYDQVFDGIKNDDELIQFLASKAKQYKLKNKKTNFELVQKNIEDRIFLDAQKNRYKIESNFPQTDLTLILINSILYWHENQVEILDEIKKMLTEATAVDGLSGEKGLASYSAILPRTLSRFLTFYDLLDKNFINNMIQDVPNLTRTFRFHMDTWINQEYYPRIGDTGRFGEKVTKYAGARFDKNPLGTTYRDLPFVSIFSLFWKFFEITGDTDYVKIIYQENDKSVDGLPFDLFVDDSNNFQANVRNVIQKSENKIFPVSINLENWCLALMRSGEGKKSRVLWIDYDIGGNHCQADGLNIGLFAKGLDLLPGFGYQPVQYGGWFSPKAIWYRKTAAHNTVVVNGSDQMFNVGQKETESLKQQLNPLKRHQKGRTKLWSIGKGFKAIRVDGKNLHETISLKQYERTLVLIDIDSNDSYVMDIFRIAGGKDQAKFIHGFLGDVETSGLSLQLDKRYGFETQMSNFQTDVSPKKGWSVDWKIYDYYDYLNPGSNIHLSYRDLTPNTRVSIADTWIAFGYDKGDTLIKSLVVRSQKETPSATTFVGIIEPYENFSKIKSVQRLSIQSRNGSDFSDENVCLEINLLNGYKDLLIALDVENILDLTPSYSNNSIIKQTDWNIVTDAELCFIRKGRIENVEKIVLSNGSFVKMPGLKLELKHRTPIFEVEISGSSFDIITGETEKLKAISIDRKN